MIRRKEGEKNRTMSGTVLTRSKLRKEREEVWIGTTSHKEVAMRQ